MYNLQGVVFEPLNRCKREQVMLRMPRDFLCGQSSDVACNCSGRLSELYFVTCQQEKSHGNVGSINDLALPFRIKGPTHLSKCRRLKMSKQNESRWHSSYHCGLGRASGRTDSSLPEIYAGP
ncbi:hypothetical protein WJX77_008745 [Trebouxia sp. C0004]